MKQRSLILATLLLSLLSFGQIYQPIAFPEKVDKRYVMQPLVEQDKYMKKIQKSLPKKMAESYSVQQTFGKAEMFTNGEVYLSWPVMENYVNQVLDSIIPSNLATKKIHAYIGRSSSINAYCLYDGTMVVNVGLVAEVKNEAALATIMGHELSHFIKNHHMVDLKNSLKKPKKLKGKTELEKKLNAMGFSQDHELESDLQGFSIASAANYDLEEANSNFELFIREEEYYAKRNKSSLASTDSVTINTKAGKFKANTLEKLLSTHPDMKDRKEKLAAYIKSNPQTKKVKFKMDEDFFRALQAQARLECVGLIFNGNDYQECLERSFMYHLFSPGELSFSYYIAESVRRLCLLDYRLRKKGFLTEKFTSDGFKEGESILHDLKFLMPNPERYSQIKATELTGNKIPFETYREAFAYFTKKLIDKNYQEAYLMRALFENNKGKISDNITKYLASPKAEHKDYAKHYQDNTLAQAIAENTKEIVMIPKVNFFRNEVYNYKYNYGRVDYYYKKSEIVGKQMSYEFADGFNSGFPDVKAISLVQAATENFNTKYKDETVLSRTLLARRDENEGYQVVHYYKELDDEDYIGKIDIFRLDPETWEFYKSNNINALTYASYTRHTNLGARKFRNMMLILAIPTGGMTLLFVPFQVTQYKEVKMFSYDARLGALYYDSYMKTHRLNTKKAMKMFKSLKEDKINYIKDYNSRF